MKKNFLKLFVIMIFLIVSSFIFAEKSQFLAVGNVKIVREEPLVIKREDINITIEKDKTIKVENLYTFKNIGNYNVKSTFMFWLDQNLENPTKDYSNANKNNRGKYLKNLKFYSDYDKSQNLRAVINFDENIYENQKTDNVQREWFAVSKVLESQKEGKLNVYYDLVNTDFSRTKKFIYSFNLVNNFFNKNKAEILYINIYNKSNYPIENIEFKGYNFKNVTKKNDRVKHYELLVGDVNLEDNLVIRFK